MLLKHALLFFIAGGFWLLLGSKCVFAQYTDKDSQLIIEIRELASQRHIDPLLNDSCFAARVAENLIEQMDPAAVILTKQDVDVIYSMHDRIMLAMKGESDQLYRHLLNVYVASIKRADSCLNVLINQPLSLEYTDSLRISGDRVFFDASDCMSIWEKRIRYFVLNQWYNMRDAVDSLSIETLKTSAVDGLKCRIDLRIHDEKEMYRFIQDCFLKSVALAYDPHTSYMSKDEAAMLSRMLSSTDKTFGISLSQNYKGEIVVGGIVPGSAAWNSNKLNVDDQILSIQNADSVFDFTCLSLKDAYYYINNPEVDELVFNIQKLDGKTFLLPLKKETSEVMSNRINSFILDGEIKTGYIYLPTFYSDTDDYSFLPNGCANDMAKEIIRLKREGIEALIIDLRNNTGGSMLEAIRAAGIFVDYGTLCIGVVRDEKPELLKDLSRGIIFDGPMTVMINGGSASASEMFAAALQDYNRAIITGSPSFGKSTAQVVLPVGNLYSKSEDTLVTAGYLKLTVGKFYRVTGKSHQKIGVDPDLIIVDSADNQDYMEVNMSFALSNDSVQKESYYKPLPELPVDSLVHLSSLRLLENPNLNSTFDPEMNASKEIRIPLDSIGYMTFREAQQLSECELDAHSPFAVDVPEYIRGMSDVNHEGEIFHDVLKMINEDQKIIENYYIINDLINILNH
jgi:carboxyl-terminal processing protease